MSEHPNVALVRKCLDHVASGDMEGVAAMWSDKLSYFAFDETGPPAEIQGREEFLDMMRNGRQMVGEHAYDILDIRAVGDELVVAHLRMHATSSRTGQKLTTDYLGVFRVQDERLVMGCDFLNRETAQFMEELWA